MDKEFKKSLDMAVSLFTELKQLGRELTLEATRKIQEDEKKRIRSTKEKSEWLVGFSLPEPPPDLSNLDLVGFAQKLGIVVDEFHHSGEIISAWWNSGVFTFKEHKLDHLYKEIVIDFEYEWITRHVGLLRYGLYPEIKEFIKEYTYFYSPGLYLAMYFVSLHPEVVENLGPVFCSPFSVNMTLDRWVDKDTYKNFYPFFYSQGGQIHLMVTDEAPGFKEGGDFVLTLPKGKKWELKCSFTGSFLVGLPPILGEGESIDFKMRESPDETKSRVKL